MKKDYSYAKSESIDTKFGKRDCYVLGTSWHNQIFQHDYLHSKLLWFDAKTGILLRSKWIVRIRALKNKFEADQSCVQDSELISSNVPAFVEPLDFSSDISAIRNKSISELLQMQESKLLEFKSALMDLQNGKDELDYLHTQRDEAQQEIIQGQRLHTEDQKLLRRNLLRIDENIRSARKGSKLKLEFQVLKTICAFMNTEGGILVIGFDVKNRRVVGVEKEYENFGNKNWDSWQQHLVNIIDGKIGRAYLRNIDIKDFVHENKTLAVVEVKRSPRPCYVIDPDNISQFYIRGMNTSKPLKSKEEIEKYVSDHWGLQAKPFYK